MRTAMTRTTVLVHLVAGLARPAASQVDQQRAQEFFREARALCERDGWVRVAPFGGHEGECWASPVDTSRVGASLARAGIA